MPKRTIAEWLTVAKISRETGHLFFEGASDARVVRDFFQYPPNVDFRTADEVESDGTSDHPLCGGHKRRLIELAVACAEGSSSNILCYVDGDFAALISLIYRRGNIIETGYANLPVSTLTFSWLRSFLSKSYGFILDQPTWQFICEALRYAFFARFVNATSERSNHAPALSDFISLRQGNLNFDRKSYLVQYFQVQPGKIEATSTSIEQFLHAIKRDIRYLANSNDVFDIVYSILRKMKKIESSTPKDTIRQAYFGAFDNNVFTQQNFKEVRDWIALYP